MKDTLLNSSRIAKNTAFLYVRMLVMMAIVFYTSRIVLNALGIEDYGLYNTIGGVVALFSAASTTLSVAINRFLTYELETGNKEKLKKVFSTSINIQLGVVVVFLFVAETIGLWYLNEKMVIPYGRINAANWCFQLSMVSFAINLISVPYNSAIIAHERMTAFAAISIIDAVGKLAIAWGVSICAYDRLLTYALGMMIVALFVRTIYAFYCKRNFEECSYRFVVDYPLISQIFGFVGWTFIGVTSCALKKHGVILLINLFFGTIISAAYAIALQVETAVSAFVGNFMTALNPQIIKAYAANDKDYMFKLIFKGAKFSSFILLFFAIPIILNTQYILELWLKHVPANTVQFVRLIIVLTCLTSMTVTLSQAQIATGEVKKYQLIVSPIGLLTIPIGYIIYSYGLNSESIIIVSIVLSQFTLIASLLMLRSMIGLSITRYFKEVYMKFFIVTIISFILPYIVSQRIEEPLVRFLLVTISSVCSTALAVLYVGCYKRERELILEKIRYTFLHY